MATPSCTIVLVFDDPAATANIREVLVNNPSVEVLATFQDGQSPRPFMIKEDKKEVAIKLGRHQAASDEIINLLAHRMREQAGDIILSREEMELLMQKTGQDVDYQPIEYAVSFDKDGQLPEGPIYEELGPEKTVSETQNTPTDSEQQLGGDEDQDSGKPPIGLAIVQDHAA